MMDWLSRRLHREHPSGEVPQVEPMPDGEMQEQRKAHIASIERSERVLSRFHDLEKWLTEGGDRRRRDRGRTPERRGAHA